MEIKWIGIENKAEKNEIFNIEFITHERQQTTNHKNQPLTMNDVHTHTSHLDVFAHFKFQTVFELLQYECLHCHLWPIFNVWFSHLVDSFVYDSD